jgi:hypothetical protein
MGSTELQQNHNDTPDECLSRCGQFLGGAADYLRGVRVGFESLPASSQNNEASLPSPAI